MKKTIMLTIFVLMLSFLLILTSCTVGEKETSIEKQTISKEIIVGEEKEVAAIGETHNVIIEKFKFNPSTLVIKVGDIVEWTNKDGESHTITFENGDADENLPKGSSTKVVFTEKSEFRYFCQFHPSMQGNILVN
ncbi:MAG: cupredoxin domain-containing protein [Nanoarchaeota archaeon]|nr:cupredoxin domain-containing protein [Nanoarchaeota archaeon]MBU1632379.1 cupredoxin domain-containing protein [Nanoarchaeota archaeon]MBU1876719.1 cupredoxin domain-containing protein [Nanoarchaeota archaeon]